MDRETGGNADGVASSTIGRLRGVPSRKRADPSPPLLGALAGDVEGAADGRPGAAGATGQEGGMVFVLDQAPP